MLDKHYLFPWTKPYCLQSKAVVFNDIKVNNLHCIPLILNGGLNADLHLSDSVGFLEFMRATFNLESKKDSAI